MGSSEKPLFLQTMNKYRHMAGLQFLKVGVERKEVKEVTADLDEDKTMTSQEWWKRVRVFKSISQWKAKLAFLGCAELEAQAVQDMDAVGMLLFARMAQDGEISDHPLQEPSIG